jgi:hypothetical protein
MSARNRAKASASSSARRRWDYGLRSSTDCDHGKTRELRPPAPVVEFPRSVRRIHAQMCPETSAAQCGAQAPATRAKSTRRRCAAAVPRDHRAATGDQAFAVPCELMWQRCAKRCIARQGSPNAPGPPSQCRGLCAHASAPSGTWRCRCTGRLSRAPRPRCSGRAAGAVPADACSLCGATPRAFAGSVLKAPFRGVFKSAVRRRSVPPHAQSIAYAFAWVSRSSLAGRAGCPSTAC